MADKQITQLTPEQEAKFPEYVDTWVKVGLNCDPCNFEKAKAGAIKAYEIANLEPPKWFFHTRSPYSACVMVALLRHTGMPGDAEAIKMATNEKHTASPPKDCPPLWVEVAEELAHQVTEQVWPRVRGPHKVKAGGKSRLRRNYQSMLYANLSKVDRQSALEGYDSQRWGSHEASWLAYYEFFRTECGVTGLDSIEGLKQVALNCGWWSAFTNVCILQDRHEIVKLDDDGRLHCEDGPAIRFRDGFSVYSVGGHRVPRWIIEDPDSITLEHIKKEENAETRRIMRERYGSTRYFLDIQAKVIDADSVPTDALLPGGNSIERMLIEDDEGNRHLVATDGSTRNRDFVMRVPNDMETCVQAHEALCGGLSADKQLGRS